ncbi:type IVB secretion system protein IcmH/DotU [Rhodospirillaceae bacterium SYSU D60014]|uniref:type IVB secretion system protein IcmH/DotU n=1 Tax=Virgifigura deserti TaxID=2268457 RepID=UPI000E675C8A
MSQDDPFAEPDDADRTIIRPNPGGRGPARPPQGGAAAPTASPGRAADPEIMAAIAQAGLNPLVAAASSLLTLAIRLRSSPTQNDVDGLRERVIRELKAFESSAVASGLPPGTVRAGHYVLCATLDDIVLNTPWGSHSVWPKRGMVSTFHNEVTGGERFFDILQRLQQDPGRNAEVLELMYLCLSLGFEGRLRVQSRGSSELSRVRDGLFRTLRQRRGEFERELSPRWRGIEAAHRPMSSYVPLWVVSVATAGLLTLIFMGFSYALNRASDATYAQLAVLPPTGPVSLARTVAPPPPPVVDSSQFERIRKFLEPEIAENLVVVEDGPQAITVRIRNRGMFPSGSATVEESYRPLLERVAAALRDEPGRVIVAGHTDNVPIRSLRFPSNWHLSVARAEAVREVVAAAGVDPARLTAEGRADGEPIASNDTDEGREANRRIELLLMKTGGGDAIVATQ